jgi:hypothetical protein
MTQVYKTYIPSVSSLSPKIYFINIARIDATEIRFILLTLSFSFLSFPDIFALILNIF